MKGIIFGSGQRIVKSIMDWLQLSKDERILQDNKSIFSSGILKNSHIELGGLQDREFKIVSGTNDTRPAFRIKVTEGSAFDTNGERIVINTNDSLTTYNYNNINRTASTGLVTLTLPLSTGSDDITVEDAKANYVFIKYLENVDPNLYVLNKITKARQFYKATDGFAITVTVNNVAPEPGYLLLANVDLSAGYGSSSVNYSIITDYSARQYGKVRVNRVGIRTVSAVSLTVSRTSTYTDDTDYLVDDHIKAVGDGTRTAKNPHGMAIADTGTSVADINASHQQLFHDAGIIDDGFTALSYGQSGLVFKVTNLTANQYVNIGTTNDVSSGIITADIINSANNSYEGAKASVSCPTLDPYENLTGKTLILTFDGTTSFTVTFGSVGGNTAALVAAYLNGYSGFSALATATDNVGQLVITSEGAYNSSILIGNGTANSTFGLTNGTLYEGVKTTIRIPVTAGLINNYIYVNNSGLFGYSASLPVFPNFPLYRFSSDTLNIVATIDLRVFGTDKNIHTNEPAFKFYRGQVIFPSLGSSVTTVTVVNFSRPFTSTSDVMLYFGCVVPLALNGSSFIAGANTVTNGISFTLSCTNNGSAAITPVTVNWLAMGR